MGTISLIISVLALVTSIASWYITHFLSRKRDLLNKKKEIRIQYLITAWQHLESSSNRDNDKYLSDLEKAIADIQLFGTLKQIQLSKAIVCEFADKKRCSLDKLLQELRDDLRKELDLDAVSPNDFISLRIKK
jgi:hypothetical protein